MHREGFDPNDMTAEDFLCDFCHQPWSEDRPFVEGHRGSCICGRCLTLAFADLAIHFVSDQPRDGEACTLCLEPKPDTAHWRSPAFEDTIACVNCVKRAAGVLHKDPDTPWTKPAGAPD
jgi:hypothetical protein